MHFTGCTPGIIPHSAAAATALQIYSIKIIDVHPILGWPLYIYGLVAARDTMDRNRNLLFCRSRANCQKITQDVRIHFPLFRHACTCREVRFDQVY
jgi:hypothetical protein